MRTKRKFSNEFKARIAEETLSGITTMAIACRKYQIAYGLLLRWHKEYAQGKFDNEPVTEAGYKERIAKLERMLGKLALENDALKKAFQLAISRQKQSAHSSGLIYPSLEMSERGAKC